MKVLSGGFSGAKVRRIGPFVIKTGQKKDSRKCAVINKAAASQYGFKSPRYYFNNGSFSFYEYVKGKTIAEMLLDDDRGVDVLKKLKKVINNFKGLNKNDLPYLKYYEKINELSDTPKIARVLEDLKTYQCYNNSPLTLSSAYGRAHGDLTLSNIVISNSGEIYLIDGNPNYWQTNLATDLSKLQQDIKGHWFAHLAEKKLPANSKRILLEAQGYIDYLGHNTVHLEIMDYLRIMRYSNESKHDSFARKQIAGLLNNVQR
jgi:hypothetical protein